MKNFLDKIFFERKGDAAMKVGEVQHIAVSVSDMEKALEFYRDLLGL